MIFCLSDDKAIAGEMQSLALTDQVGALFFTIMCVCVSVFKSFMCHSLK